MHTSWITLWLCCFLTSPGAQQPPEPTRVHVTVVDEQGKPVPGAKVSGTCRVKRRIDAKLMGEGFCLVPERTADSKGTLIVEMAKSELGSSLRLRASHQGAFTEKPTELKDPAGEPTITLQISRQHARALQVRVVDEKGKPISGVAIAVHHVPIWPGGETAGGSRPVLPDDKGAWVTDAEGRFTSPRILDPEGTYRLRLKAEGYLPEDTPGILMGKQPTLDFGDRTLQRLQQIAGQVKDRQGQPVAGARVLWLDTKQRVEGTTDPTGQFRLHAAIAPPGFLFVEKEGFRFHGQRHQKEEQTLIMLVRREEPSGKTMTTLPVLPRAQRKELVAKLIDPVWPRWER
jgi:protocatechuate 3,4-dioxygenase beta subunit